MRGMRKTAVFLAVVAVAMAAFGVAASTAVADERNPECLSCHGSVQDWTVAPVVKTTACVKCHTPGLLGTHPYHNPGANCGAICHPSFGESLQSAIPTFRGPEGSFAAADSVDVDPQVLHVIHSKPRWPAGTDRTTSACSSCHAAASCVACHEDPDSGHEDHSGTGNAKYPASVAWTGITGSGIVGEDQTIKTALPDTNLCGSAGCHNVTGTANNQPVLRESHSHPAYPEYGYPVANTVALTGTWRTKTAANYTFGTVAYSNITNSTLGITFTGDYVELVGDRDPYRGIAEVKLDGVVVATVDEYAPTSMFQQVLYRSPRLAAGDHTISVRVTGGKNVAARANQVFVDAFRVFPSMPTSVAPKCASCHADKTTGHGTSFSHEASVTAGTYSGYACTSCHTLKMIDEHKRSSSKTSAADSVCTECHTTYAPFNLTTPAFDYTCTWQGAALPGCHKVANLQEPHNFRDSSHAPGAEAVDAKCRACHAGNLDVIHDDSIATNAVVPNCLSCHGPNKFPASKSCTSGCHTATGVDSMENHPYVAPPHVGSGLDGGVANTGGKSCATCHKLELAPEHDKSSSVTAGGSAIDCSTCHDLAYLPRPWNDQCTACHTAGKAPVAHTGYATKHRYDLYSAVNVTSCGGADCHDVSMADAIHASSNPGNGDCTSCHDANGVPTKKLCSDCHTPHNLSTPHKSGSYAGSTECLRCHDGFGDINTAHPSCATCHKNPTLVDYLNDHYTAACTDCHKAGVLGKAYSPDDPSHYTGTETTHTASAAQMTALYDYDGVGTAYAGVSCGACHKPEMKPEHIGKTWSNFQGVPSTYADKCVACHQTKVDGLVGAWDKSCAVCHATTHTKVATVHNGSIEDAACAGGSCHDVSNVTAIHNNSITTNGITLPNNGCTACHNADTQATKDCTVCHAGHGAGAHTASNSDECVGCHESANVQDIHPTCETCHANAKYPGLTAGKNPECVTCHKSGLVGTHDYGPSDPKHYLGTETTHTASGANGVYSTYQCSQCHVMEMKPEHQKASASFSTTTTAIGKCIVCHESKVDFIVGAWDKKCASCHPATHTERAAKHDATSVASGCGGTGCHKVTDVAFIHNNSITTNGMLPNCLTCHDSNASVPDTLDCSTAGCHLGMVHGHALNLAASNYNNTSITGCTNSGAACHGSQATSPTPDFANTYHPDSGCQTGPCHQGNATQTDPAFNNPQTCQNCHGGRVTAPLNYQNAPDTVALTTATPAGHYGETSHTAAPSSLTGTVGTGGLTTATCESCHPTNNPIVGGVDGLNYQHQVLQNLGNTTCYDCHNLNVGVSAVVNGKWAGKNCSACHSVGLMPAYVQHGNGGSVAGTVNHTPNAQNNVGQCNDSGCHTNTDLHYLHRGDGASAPTSGTPRPDPSCSVCHDPQMQGWKPTRRTCGSNGDCHITQPHSDLGPAHSATALSQECINCHESTDTRTVHGQDCDLCHTYNKGGSRTWANIRNKRECVACHDGVLVGTHIYKPHDPNHYNGSETTHTATAQTGTYGAITSVVATESFNSVTWPASWVTTSAATHVKTANTGTLYDGSYYAVITDNDTTRQTDTFSRVFDTSVISSPTVTFVYQTAGFTSGDSASLEYATNGSTFTTLWSTTAAQSTWTTVGPLAVPRGGTVTLRFGASTNATTDYFRVDGFKLLPGNAPTNTCDKCHKMEMKPEHFKGSSDATRVPYTYADKCVDCHENKVDNFTGSWNRTCDACHAPSVIHDSQSSKHNATAIAGATCGGSGCHDVADVAVIHNNSSLANATVTTCTNTCHKNNTAVPATLDCGATGCHAGMSAHSHELDLSGSDFNDITVTGCTNSGNGCHGNSTSTNYTTYHPNTGCLTGKCHTAANHNDAQFNDPNTCMNCHGGGALTYAGATDRVPVDGATPGGHYPETTHTAGPASRTASLTAGGTISARCNQCHNDVNASGIDGLYFQHQGLSGGLGNTSCAQCHNYNAGVTAQVKTNWPSTACSGCHNSTDMPTYVQHSTATAPAVTATEAQGAGTCQTVGCHTTLDLHALHKGTASTPAARAAAGCALAGCHDYAKQGAKPTKKRCGVGGDCHTTTPTHPNETAAHQALSASSITCFKCHEGASGATTDVRSIVKSQGYGTGTSHAGCVTCHNGTTNLGASNTANCVDCHNANAADTSKIGLRNYDSYDPNHDYVTSHDASSTATGTFGTTGYGSTLTNYNGTTVNYERQCITCHKQQTGGSGVDLVFEHKKSSSATSTLSAYSDVCVGCHEVRVDNMTTRWAGSCSGEGTLCHNVGAGALHGDWSTKHNASTQVMSAPGSSFAEGATTQAYAEDFGTTTTWDTAWTRSSTTYVTNQTTSAHSGAAAQIGVNTIRTTYNFYTTSGVNLSSYSGGNISFWYQTNVSDTADYLICEYSTTSATTGYTELFRVNTDALTWTQSPTLTLPAGSTVWIRFTGTVNLTGEYLRIDDVVVNGSSAAAFGAALPANSTAAVSCGNPTGNVNPQSECHDVTDVADIHSSAVGRSDFGCPICHASTSSVPTTLNCQTAGCHAGINNDNHNTAWHESAMADTATFGTGFATDWCRGCHDDSIDNEHFVLGAYGSNPCSVCHKKAANSAAPTSVTAANTQSAIHGDATAGNVLCTTCHKTVTKSAIHVQRTGDGGTPGTQFNDTWSGHRVYDTMYGSRTGGTGSTFNGQATTITWSLPTATSWLKAGWTTTTMGVRCSDCHGTMTGATGPHGGSVSVKMATGYDRSYSSGSLYLNGTSMSNTTNICAKCHTTSGMGYNNIHNRSDHQGSSDGKCINCHVPTAHAWKRPRLLGYKTDPLPYRTLLLTNITARSYTPSGWSDNYCGQSGCGHHSSSASTPLWP